MYGSNNAWFQVNPNYLAEVSVAKEFLFLAIKENFPFLEKIAQKSIGQIGSQNYVIDY